MTQEHPITLPPELVVEWADTIYQQTECDDQRDLYVATQAARWGADQELEACCEWFREEGWNECHPNNLRTARRPNPPSLKEQALAELNLTTDSDGAELSRTQVELIRRALESLHD